VYDVWGTTASVLTFEVRTLHLFYSTSNLLNCRSARMRCVHITECQVFRTKANKTRYLIAALRVLHVPKYTSASADISPTTHLRRAAKVSG
jgi:hypothetical protein